MNDPENSGVIAVEDTRYGNIVTTIEAEEPVTKEPEPVQKKAEEEPQDNGEKPKEKKGGFTKKLALKDAQIAEKNALIAELQGKPKAETPTDKPKLDDFETFDAWTEAVADWKIDQKLSERDTKAREESMRTEMQQRDASYKAKANEFAKANPDFDEVVTESEWFNPIMANAIQESDIGPEIAYYLANTPEEAESIFKMGVVQANKAIGRIEAKLELSREAKPAVRTTNAPPPIKPVTKTAVTTVDPYSQTMENDAYKEWRRKQR